MNQNQVLIIAEAGVNHNGSLETATKLVDAAAEAGADMVKFQTFSADQMVTTSARKAEYQNQTTDALESQHDMIRKLELSREMHEELIAYCRLCDIEFFSTGFDTQSIDMLVELGLEQFKIPSGEITNLPYLRHVGQYGKSVIISTGMANLGEIEAALEVLETSGTPRNQITVLHCNTEYPTPMEDVNLRAMISIGEVFKVSVGYSDHTLGDQACLAAVACGARIIEKHFTLDHNYSDFRDHQLSANPAEMADLVKRVRQFETLLGSGKKVASQVETEIEPAVRRSIVTRRELSAGHILERKDLTWVRPAGGMAPGRESELVGNLLCHSVMAGHQLSPEDVEKST